MSSQKFKSVNDEFLIRNSISDELLDKCFTFVNNQFIPVWLNNYF